MRVVMLTLNRSPIYVRDSLASLFASNVPDDLRVWLLNTSTDGRPGDHGFLGDWANDPRVDVFDYDAATRRRAELLTLRERCALAHHLGLAFAGGDEIILLEDDVRFARGWYDFTIDALELLPLRSRSIVELHSPHMHTVIDGSTPLAVYDVMTYYGSQGAFFGADAVAPARAALEPTPARANRKHSSDTLLQAWLIEDPQPFYAIVPSVIQHVGRESSIGSAFHHAPSFRDDL